MGFRHHLEVGMNTFLQRKSFHLISRWWIHLLFSFELLILIWRTLRTNRAQTFCKRSLSILLIVFAFELSTLIWRTLRTNVAHTVCRWNALEQMGGWKATSYKLQLMRLENGLKCEFSLNKVGYHVSEFMAQMIYSKIYKHVL